MRFKIRELLGFNDWWLMLFGIPLLGFVSSMILFGNQILEGDQGLFPLCVFAGMIYVTLYWIPIRTMIILFRRFYPLENNIIIRVIGQVIIIISTYYVTAFILDQGFNAYVHNILEMQQPSQIVENISSLLMAFMVVSIYESIYIYSRLQKSIVEKEQLEKANIISQLEGLKNQVNPHFLFNSLNTLAQLIPEDAEKSVRFVEKLSKVYRYILEIKDTKLITLEKELAYLNAYIFLVKERFGENIEIDIKIPEEKLSQKVVPLSLQILLENAIKHNIISSSSPLRIDIFIKEEDYLIVRNNLQKKKLLRPSTKVGLENIKNRYQFLSNKLVEVIITNQAFSVSIPLLNTHHLLSSK